LLKILKEKDVDSLNLSLGKMSTDIALNVKTGAVAQD